ncbi:MAG TPA: sigma-70 family RNA polymerase sigma factor [Candidatus Acidoferrum sp.]|nr:sigma-70 family RNA polymerase sigma factor [Candidatus Acidoferrum sp.]
MFRWRTKKQLAEPARVSDRAATADADLVHASRTGDKRAFVEIVARHQAMVCGVALGVLGDFAASEDAAQEAFLTAWRKLHDLREPERLRPWLAQIARNAALGHLRRQRGHHELDDALTVADESPLPDEVAAMEEETALVREALARLPETYRLPLVLFYREGQSVSAVAESLGLSDDAVKQRLARGREMLRDRMSGLIETVLTRTGPTPVFTMTIAVTIGALASPAAIAGAVFTTASAAAGVTATASTTPLLTAMSTSKTCLIAAAVVAAVCIPVGYRFSAGHVPPATASRISAPVTNETGGAQSAVPTFENSALFAEWRGLHETYGTTPDAMPAIYKAIADMNDPFRRRAFRAALISEWVQLDPANGLKFFLSRSGESSQRRQFFEEWLAQDAGAAVNTLVTSGPGWEKIARDSLTDIARCVPSHVPEIVSRLPKSEDYWDTKVNDAFAILAESGLASARKAAESMTGPNREQALAGVARAWAKSDLTSAIKWAKALPDGIDRDEIIRAALIGKAVTDPIAALDQISIVPAGGRDGYFATTTGSRVIRAAADVDYDGTVTWIAANPGRLGHYDMMGLAKAVTDRLNADPAGFLLRHAADGSLQALMPAIQSAILNEAGGQRAAIWDWLKTQPENDATATLRRQVLDSAGYQDPSLALKMAKDLPRTTEGDAQVKLLAQSLWNGGQMLHRYDKLVEQAPERLRAALIESAFTLRPDSEVYDAQVWIGRLAQLPESARARGTESVARNWAAQAPDEAVAWVSSMPAGETRSSAVAAIASTWAAKDASTAAAWVAAMSPGLERDRSANSLVQAITEQYPKQAWDWALTIDDSVQRNSALTHVANKIPARDREAARQWIESAPLAPELKAQLQSGLGKNIRTGGK